MTTLTDDKQRLLRQNGLMSEVEIAYEEDDLIVVENLATKSKRTMPATITRPLFESNRILLKG